MDVTVDVSNAEIQTERLLLRSLKMTDLEDFYAYASVAGVGEKAGWKHHESKEESKNILQSLADEKSVFAIVHKADQKMIGTIGLHPSWANDMETYQKISVKEIGYVLSKTYWGQGLMPEAVYAVMHWAFDVLHLEALTCCHFLENSQSRRVIEKSGFQYVKQGLFESKQLQKTFEERQYILMREHFA